MIHDNRTSHTNTGRSVLRSIGIVARRAGGDTTSPLQRTHLRHTIEHASVAEQHGAGVACITVCQGRGTHGAVGHGTLCTE